jgi:diaminopropionate ammonia-lyase
MTLINSAYTPAAVAAPSSEAIDFHRALPGYAPTPVHDLGGGVWLKDESNRLGLPAFKVLGVSWAVERALRADPGLEVLVAASAGNHGRAVAHVAARRGLRARVFLPERSVAARREAIAGEGAEVIVVDGTYEDAVRLAAEEGARPGAIELADVGSSGPAHWVIDGYATLFAELEDRFDAILVPVGVGSLGAAAARYGAQVGGRPLRIDLSELAFMDSTGLRAMLTAAREQTDLKLRGPLQPPVERLLELTQTNQILPFE